MCNLHISRSPSSLQEMTVVGRGGGNCWVIRTFLQRPVRYCQVDIPAVKLLKVWQGWGPLTNLFLSQCCAGSCWRPAWPGASTCPAGGRRARGTDCPPPAHPTGPGGPAGPTCLCVESLAVPGGRGRAPSMWWRVRGGRQSQTPHGPTPGPASPPRPSWSARPAGPWLLPPPPPGGGGGGGGACNDSIKLVSGGNLFSIVLFELSSPVWSGPGLDILGWYSH